MLAKSKISNQCGEKVDSLVTFCPATTHILNDKTTNVKKMDKSSLRKKYKELRSQFTDDQIEDQSVLIANQLLQIPIWDKTYYHIFLPITSQKEINTEYILHILQGKDKNIVVSKSNFEDLSLTHFLLTDATQLHANAWGIPEPIDGIPVLEDRIEVVFIPLLAFDSMGNRVGYGKGFYDRFLSNCVSDVVKIGLSLFRPEIKINDISTTDVHLDYCITPQEIYKF